MKAKPNAASPRGVYWFLSEIPRRYPLAIAGFAGSVVILALIFAPGGLVSTHEAITHQKTEIIKNAPRCNEQALKKPKSVSSRMCAERFEIALVNCARYPKCLQVMAALVAVLPEAPPGGVVIGGGSNPSGEPGGGSPPSSGQHPGPHQQQPGGNGGNQGGEEGGSTGGGDEGGGGDGPAAQGPQGPQGPEGPAGGEGGGSEGGSAGGQSSGLGKVGESVEGVVEGAVEGVEGAVEGTGEAVCGLLQANCPK